MKNLVHPLDYRFHYSLDFSLFSVVSNHLSRIIKNPAFCICKNKGADQLRRNLAADQHLCFRYIDTAICLHVLPLSEISSL